MLNTTLEILKSALRGDPSVSPGERTKLVQLLRKGASANAEAAQPKTARILRRAEVAAMLNRSLRFVDTLAKRGVVSKVKLPGRQRALGFRQEDILALISEA